MCAQVLAPRSTPPCVVRTDWWDRCLELWGRCQRSTQSWKSLSSSSGACLVSRQKGTKKEPRLVLTNLMHLFCYRSQFKFGTAFSCEMHASAWLLRHLILWLNTADANHPQSQTPSVTAVWSCFHVTRWASFCRLQVQKLAKNEVLMVNIGSLSTGGRVQAVRADLAKIGLTNPVCTEIGEKIALSRRVEKHWRWVC